MRVVKDEDGYFFVDGALRRINMLEVFLGLGLITPDLCTVGVFLGSSPFDAVGGAAGAVWVYTKAFFFGRSDALAGRFLSKVAFGGESTGATLGASAVVCVSV